jgi:hypothetical protein
MILKIVLINLILDMVMIFKKIIFYFFTAAIISYFFYSLNYMHIALEVLKFNGFKYSNIELYKENNVNSLYIKDLYYNKNKLVDEVKVKFIYDNKQILIEKIYIKNIKLDFKNLIDSKSKESNSLFTLDLLELIVNQIKINKLYVDSNYYIDSIEENIKFNGVTKNININISDREVSLSENVQIKSFIKIFNQQTILNVNIKRNFDILINMKNDFLKCNFISNNMQNTILFNIKTNFNKLLNGVDKELSFLDNSKLLNANFEINGLFNTKQQKVKNLNIININSKDKFLIGHLEGDFKEIKLEEITLEKLSLYILDRKIQFSNKAIITNQAMLKNNKGDFIINYNSMDKILNIEFNDFYVASKRLGIQKTILNGLLNYSIIDNKITSNLHFKETLFKPTLEIETNIINRISKKELNMSNIIKLKKELKKEFKINFDLQLEFLKSKAILSSIEINNNFKISVKNLNPGLFYKGTLNIEQGKINIANQVINIENSFLFLNSEKENTLNFNFNKKVEDIQLFGNVYGALDEPKFDLFSDSNLTEKEIAILLLKNKEVLNTFQKLQSTKESNAKLNSSIKGGIMIFNLLKGNFIEILGINIDKVILDSKINNFTNTEEVMINIEKKINKRIIFKYEKIGNDINSYDVNYKINKNISFDFEHVEEYGNSHQGIFINFEN